MPMSQIASSGPTPRSTSRVMMTGLIGPDLRREDCWSGSSHDDWRKTSAEKLGVSNGRSSKDGTTFYRLPPMLLYPTLSTARNQRARAEPANRRGEGITARQPAYVLVSDRAAMNCGSSAGTITVGEGKGSMRRSCG